MGYTGTNNYGFQKPAKENAFTVDDLNNALNKIDETIKSQVDTLNESLDALDNKIDEVASKSGISFATRLPDGTTYSITTKSGSSVASGEWAYPISFILDPGIYNLTLNILSQTYTMEFVVTDIPVTGDISDIVCMLNISNLAGVIDISYDSKHIATSDDISYSIGVPKSASQHTLSFTATASYGNGVMPFTITPIPITPNTPSLDVPVSRSITINLITSDLPSFTVPFDGEYEIIAVGGGGAGGGHGGGGGGYITVKTETLNAGTPYDITIGEGATSLAASGGITSFSNLISASGGGGGTTNGGSGGSGGGGSGNYGGNGGRGYFGGGGGGGDSSGRGGNGGAGGTYGGGGGGGEGSGSGGSKGTHGGAGGRGGSDTTQPTDGNAGTNTTSMDLLFKGAGNAGSAGSYRGSKNGGGGGGGGYGGNGGNGSGSGGAFGGGGGGGYGGNGGNASDGGGGGGGYGGNGGNGGSISADCFGGGGGGYGTSPASIQGSGTGYGAGGSGHPSSFSGKSGCVVIRMIS